MIKNLNIDVKPDGTFSLLSLIIKLEKDKGFQILKNRISYLDPKYNCYEFCWCRNVSEDNINIPKDIYKQKNGENLVF